MITPEQEEELIALVRMDKHSSPHFCALERGACADAYSGSLVDWFEKRFPGTTPVDAKGVMNGWDSAVAGIPMAFVFRAHEGDPDFEAGRAIGKKLYALAFPMTEVTSD